ncbi:MAG: hypothetical protein K2N48_09295 [Muribaculaceae bacterium]|nr:hypothetical protein [Muribaculaceae bacterium]
MKTTVFRLIFIMALFAPVTVASQTNIKSAFDAIIKYPKAEITESHSLQKDRETNQRLGQDDIYTFILPADRFDLVKNVMAAFDKDMASAYGVKKGKNTGNEIKIRLYSSQSTPEMMYVISIDDPGCDYIYQLFAPSKSEDPDGIHRYAYGFNYKEEDGKIKGKIVINYATTAEYRQQVQQEAEREKNLRWLADMGEIKNGTSESVSQDSWFDMLMSYFQSMPDATSKTRIALATKAFKVIRDTSKYPEVTPADKDAIREILKVMVSDINYSESVLNKLLNQCLVELK